MNNFQFCLKINGLTNNEKRTALIEMLNESPDSEVLKKNYEEFDADKNYLGLIAPAICGESAFSWYELFGRAFIDGFHQEKESIVLYVRLNGPYNYKNNNPLIKLIEESSDDLSLELFVDEEDYDTLSEFGEGYKIVVSKDGELTEKKGTFDFENDYDEDW